MNPYFSVVIPCFNRANFLPISIKSVLKQSFQDFEIIIIDDGSTDNTKSVVSSFNCDKIKYFYKENEERNIARNYGVEKASGKYIVFLDSDDEYSPAHLETRKALLMKNNEVEFLYGGVKVIGSEYVPDRHNYQKMVHLSTCAIGGTFFIKKRVSLLLNGFIEMPLGSDGDLFERACNMGINMLKTEIPNYIYHSETLNSITNNISGFINSCGMDRDYSSDYKNYMELI